MGEKYNRRPRTELTTENLGTFLDVLSQYGNVTRAAEAAAVSRTALYKRKAEDEEFAKAWDEAVQIGNKQLEDEARRRALEGVVEPVFDKDGNQTGERIKYSDTLLIFLLKGNNPDKFKDRVQGEITGKGGGPIQHQHSHELGDLAQKSVDDLIGLYQQVAGGEDPGQE